MEMQLKASRNITSSMQNCIFGIAHDVVMHVSSNLSKNAQKTLVMETKWARNTQESKISQCTS